VGAVLGIESQIGVLRGQRAKSAARIGFRLMLGVLFVPLEPFAYADEVVIRVCEHIAAELTPRSNQSGR
jgi:hypothetical protein